MLDRIELIKDDFESIKKCADTGYAQLVEASEKITHGLTSATLVAFSKNYSYSFDYTVTHGPACDVSRMHHESGHSEIVARFKFNYSSKKAGTWINLLSRQQALIV